MADGGFLVTDLCLRYYSEQKLLYQAMRQAATKVGARGQLPRTEMFKNTFICYVQQQVTIILPRPRKYQLVAALLCGLLFISF